MQFLRDFSREVGAVKPVKAWADRALIDGTPTLNPGLVAGNIAVNNALDINYYKQLALSPESVLKHERSPFFLGVGHSYLKAYGDTVHVINGSCDFADGQFAAPSATISAPLVKVSSSVRWMTSEDVCPAGIKERTIKG